MSWSRIRNETCRLGKYSIIGFVGILLFVPPIFAQRCGLNVGAYVDSDPTDTFVGISSLHTAPKGLVDDIQAWAINQKTKLRYTSVLSKGLRYFGELQEGQYTVTVEKVGFRPTAYGVKLTCTESLNGALTKYVRIWPGRGDQLVDNSKIPVNELRFDQFVKLGSSNSDSNNPDTTHSRTVSGGVLNGRATSLPLPTYPAAAKAVRASGTVSVEILIDELGEVVSAKAVGGNYIDMNSTERMNGAHPLLIRASESAAMKARFSPTLLDGKPVRVTGVLTYNFTL